MLHFFALLLLVMGGQAATSTTSCRCRPTDPCWPSPEAWEQLDMDVGGNLETPKHPLNACLGTSADPAGPECQGQLQQFGSAPFFLSSQSGATQSSGGQEFKG